MIAFTDRAREKVLSFMKAEGKPDLVLRMAVSGRTASGFNYQFFLEDRADMRADDRRIEADGFSVVVDEVSGSDLDGATVDWVESGGSAGFKVDNPDSKSRKTFDSPVAGKVQALLDDEINPQLAGHGGFIELLDVKDNRAFIRMSGGCQGCASRSVTLKQGVEARIRQVAPEITEVLDTTDHAAGSNPYYRDF